jgi:hypothetical protein
MKVMDEAIINFVLLICVFNALCTFRIANNQVIESKITEFEIIRVIFIFFLLVFLEFHH